MEKVGSGVDLVVAFIPLVELVPSKTNPRKVFDPKKIAEMAASMKTHGVVNALTVRRLNPESDGERFEIVAGECRSRAAKIAGLKNVPCSVKVLADQEVQEIQLIENGQRSDLHPLEEGDTFIDLKTMGLDVPSIAARVGKTESVVYQRMKLAELIGPVRKAFAEGKISDGHAILIARLPGNDQKKSFDHLVNPGYQTTGLEDQQKGGAKFGVKAFGRWIQENFYLELKNAPFPVDDAELVPAAGACTDCPKNTGTVKALFAEIQTATCTDGSCWGRKVEAFIEIQVARTVEKDKTEPVRVTDKYLERARKDGALGSNHFHELKKGDKRCDSTVTAIYVEGRDAGKLVSICADAKCSVHKKEGIEDPRKAEHEAARKKTEGKEFRTWRAIRGAVVDAIMGAAPARLSREQLGLIAVAWFDRQMGAVQVGIYKRHGWEPGKRKEPWGVVKVRGGKDVAKRIAEMKDQELSGFLLEMAIAADVNQSEYSTGKNQLSAGMVEIAATVQVVTSNVAASVRRELEAKSEGRKVVGGGVIKKPKAVRKPKAKAKK